MNTYTLGTAVLLAGAFTNMATGAPVAPSSVVCRITTPDGVVTDESVSVTSPTTGVYNLTYLPTQYGLHLYEFIGSGGLNAAGVRSFLVNQRTF